MEEIELLGEVKYTVGEINFNKTKIKNEVVELVKKYDNLIITSDSEIKDFKDIRANLNKVVKAIDDKRKQIKTVYSEPINNFEKDVKEITKIIDDVNSKIDAQIKDYEQKEKDKKLDVIYKYIENYGLTKYATLIIKEEWLNKTYSISTIDAELEMKKAKISEDLIAIDNFATGSIEKAELLSDYEKCLDLTTVINNYNERKLVIKNAIDDSDTTKHTITLEISATKGEMEVLKDLLEKLNVEYKRVK